MKPLGYMYCVCEFCPDGKKDCTMWESIRYLDHRDNLADAEKIVEVLQQTDINWTSYGIVLRPVWPKKQDFRDQNQEAPSTTV